MGVPFKAKNGLDANSNKIVNVSNPTTAQDAATKLYVDNAVGTGLPSQTGNSGKFLTTNATTASWSLVPVAGINATGTPSATTYLRGDGTWATVAAGGVTSVTGTSPVASSGGTTPAISLNSGYGDTQNPYASKTANYVLAAPNGSAGVPTFRAIVAADIPTLNQNTTGSAGSVPASGLTGATLASGVTASSLTSVGTLGTLTVSGGSFFGGLGINGLDGSINQIWQSNASTNLGIMANGGPILFGQTSSEQMRLTAGGLLGIGTASPSFKLDVNGTGNFNGVLSIASGTATSGANQGLAIYHGSDASGYGRIRFYENNTNNATIHNFSSTWQSGSSSTINTTSTGCINIDGPYGVTIGAWNGPNVSFNRATGLSTFNGAITATGLTVTTNPSYFRKNQTDGSYTTAAIWTESYGTTTTGIAFHISGVAGKFLEMRTNGTLYFDNFVMLNSGNYNSYAPTLTGTGASGTWGISITGSAGSVTGLTINNSGSVINPNSVTQNQIGYANSVSLFGETDGGLYSSAYNSTWIHEIFGDFRTGQIAIRGKNSGTFTAWRTVLDSTNYTSYSPTLTGTGASGTWGINITGNSATATQLSFSGNTRYMAANQWAGAGGYDGYTFVGGNSRFGFSSTGGYVDVYTDGNFYAGIDLNGLNNLVLHAGNYSSYAIARGGDTVDGVILFRSNKGNNVYLSNTNTMQLQAYSSDGGTAAMSFHRNGQYAVNFGLDPDNVLRLGGWSAPANVMQVNMSGDLTMLRYIFATDFNQSGGNSSNPTIGQIWTQNTSDNYCRKSTPAHFKTQLNLYSGAAGSGVITISQSAPSGGATNDIWLQW